MKLVNFSKVRSLGQAVHAVMRFAPGNELKSRNALLRQTLAAVHFLSQEDMDKLSHFWKVSKRLPWGKRCGLFSSSP